MTSPRHRERFESWVESPEGDADLGEGALLVATLERPDLDVDAWIERLNALGEAAGDRVAERSGEIERAAALMEYLFGELGLAGNRDEYYDPMNSFLDRVIERRLGIPVTLSVAAIEIGRRAGVPLEGVGFPGHFLVRHASHREVLFDPFEGGAWIAQRDCEEKLRAAVGENVRFEPGLLIRSGPHATVARILRNLRAIYAETEDNDRLLGVLEFLVRLEPEAWDLVRDRGLVLMRHGRFGEGAGELERYLAACPEAEDRERVEKLVRGARNYPTVH